MNRILVSMIAGLICLAAPLSSSRSEAQELWQVVEVSGEVTMSPQGIIMASAPSNRLVTGQTLAPGTWIATAANSRIQLQRGGESIVVSPNSLFGIPRDASPSFRTTILQVLGTLLFKIEKRPEQHFEVQAPNMTAIVKGTTFAVAIDGGDTAVHVIGGVVEVADFTANEIGLVHAGQTAIVSRDSRGLTISGRGHIDTPRRLPGSARAKNRRSFTPPGEQAEDAGDRANNGQASNKANRNFGLLTALGHGANRTQTATGILQALLAANPGIATTTASSQAVARGF